MLDMLSAIFICEQFLIFHSPHFTGKWVELNLIDKQALEQAWIKNTFNPNKENLYLGNMTVLSR